MKFNDLLYVSFLIGTGQVSATSLMPGLLSDPEKQPFFEEIVPNLLNPGHQYDTSSGRCKGRPLAARVNNGPSSGLFKVWAGDGLQETGLVDGEGRKLKTPIWGYGPDAQSITWPGPTFDVMKGDEVTVKWINDIYNTHLLTGVGEFEGQSVVDPTLHWAYGLPNCQIGSDSSTYCGGMDALDKYGIPIVVHLHGGYTDYQYDGGPEFFYSRGYKIKGPKWEDKDYVYENKQPAGSLWYHDHALGLTRLHVYGGMAGFYFIRDEYDTGKHNNPLKLPAYPYESALLIQDRMFKKNGELFYPAFAGEPGYADYIDQTIQDKLPNDQGPSVLTEFFGDHMVVNGRIWPKSNVEPRKYRLRLLNGCDSRFLMLQFIVVDVGATEIPAYPEYLPFTVIGSDQGLANSVDWITIGAGGKSDFLVFEPAGRYDIIIDFKGLKNKRVIMRNLGDDAPFNGAINGVKYPNSQTDKIMSFDVVKRRNHKVKERDIDESQFHGFGPSVTKKNFLVAADRQVALFEGQDEFGRLQPVLGIVGPSKTTMWPDFPVYRDAGLIGPIQGAVGWHTPTPVNPSCNTIETWEIWNPTADAHPFHVHLVHIEVVGRYSIIYDSNVDADGRTDTPQGDGTFIVQQALVEHMSMAGDPSTLGTGYRIMNPTKSQDPVVDLVGHHFVSGRKDMVIALPGQVTLIKMKFDKPGLFVWHCHILSHEDHEMMLEFRVKNNCQCKY